MGFLVKLIARIVLNGAALWIASAYFPGFIMGGGFETLIIGALTLAILYTFIRPILRLVSSPLVWITFGLFNIVINMSLLWIADKFLTQLTIADLATLFWVAIIITIANAFF